MVDTSHLAHLLHKRSMQADEPTAADRTQCSPSVPTMQHDTAQLPAAPVQLAPHSTPQLSVDDEVAAHRKKHARFFTMLRLGISRETVEQAMRLAGIDPVELDGPHRVVDIAPTSASKLLPGALVAAEPVKDGEQGSGQRGRKKAIRKRLTWDVKMRDAVTSSSHHVGIWNTPCNGAHPPIVSRENMVLLEKLFVKEAIAPVHGTHGFVSKKPARVSILEAKKAQNIAIILARVKLSLPQLIRELVDMNPTILCTAQLQGLLDMWPDRKELEAIDDFSGDVALLGEAEQLFVEVKNIPRFREKLSCLVFKQEFPLRVHELRESINLVIRGVNQVCSSLALQQLFNFVLQIGNLLNFGTESAHAAKITGFSLSSLEKVAQTKAFVGGITLLQFVVQAVSRDCPHLASFYTEINLISKCCNVSIHSLLVEQQALEAGWKAVVHEARAGILAASDTDDEMTGGGSKTGLANSILMQFASEVESEMNAIQDLFLQLKTSKQRFLEHFDEQDATDELDVLLRHIARFTEEFAYQQSRVHEVKQAVEKAVRSNANKSRSAAVTA